MSYGFSATNNYNQVLISSDTKNLHFIGKAYLYSTIKASDYYGGMRQWSFRIGTSKNIAPLPFFSMTGDEYYAISAVRQISTAPNIIITTQPITVIGQIAKYYSWTNGPGAINEGSDNVYSIATTNVATGTVLYWDISPSTSDDFQYTDGSFIIDSAGNGSFQITPTKLFDPYPETAENYTINIRSYLPLTGTVVLSYTFTVNNQTSSDITGFGWTTDSSWGASTLSEGSNMPGTGTPAGTTFIVTATQGNNAVIATSDIITISSDYAETYTFTTLPLTMNEGTAYNVVVSTTNVINGTVIYFTLNSTNKNEFIVDEGSFTINNNSGTFSITPSLFYDPYPETGYTNFTISLNKRYGQNDNLTVVAITTTNNPTINIAAVTTSQTTGLGWQNNALWGTDPITEGVIGSGIPNDTGTTTSTVPTNTFIVTDTNPNNPVIATSDQFAIVNTYLTINANPVLSGANFRAPTSADLTASGYTGGDLANYTSTYGNILLEGQSFTVNLSSSSTTLINGTVFYWDVQALGTGLPVIPMTVYTDGLASPEAITNDFSTRSGSIVINFGAGSFTVPSIRVNEWAMKETKYEFFKLNIRMGAELTGPIIKTVPFQILDQPFTADSLPHWGDPDNQSTRGIVANMNEGTTNNFYVYNGVSGNNSNSNANYYWTINHITTNNSDFTAVSGQITSSKTNATSGFTQPTGIFSITTAADNLTEGLKRFNVSIRIGSITGTIVQTSGEIRLLDTSTSLPPLPRILSTSHANLLIDEAVVGNITVNYTLTLASALSASASTRLYWRINHVTTDALDFVNTNGFVTVAANATTATFSIVIKPGDTAASEQTEYFSVSVVEKAAANYRYWSINHVTTNASDFITTSGVCLPGGYNWWYFYVNATADNLTEGTGTEKFTLSIANSTSGILCTSGQIAITDASQGRARPYIIGSAKVAENVANTYSVFTSGLSDGTYYWRINDITTSTVQNITPTSTGDFTTSWGEVTITNNSGTFSVTAANDGLTEYEEKYTISLVNKAAADKYWTIEHITTNDSDFNNISNYCIPGGYNWWYFNIPVVADYITEGTEKFNIQIRQGSDTGTVLTKSGAISILDTSLGYYSVIPGALTESFVFNATIFTPGVADGTTLYWDINHITTSDLDFVTTFGSFAASTSGATISITAVNYDAAEFDEGFTINVRTQPKYIWEIELIRSGIANTVPEVYIFAEASASALSLTETMGLRVLRDDGSTSFDSRLGPLVINAATAVTQPYNPRPSPGGGLYSEECRSNGQQAGDALAPDLSNYNAYNIANIPNKPIYHYTSLAQAQRQTNAHRDRQECTGFNAYGGCVGYAEEEHWDSDYWCFYRGGIKNFSNTYIHAGWIPVTWNCYWRYSRGASLLGVGYGNGGDNGGGWPYNNETINLSSGVVIIADGALYD